MIEQAQRILLEALKASLFDIEPSYPEDTDWNEVIKEAKAQTVMGLISPVIPMYDESTDQGKANYMQLLYEQDKLLRLLDANNIPCVILKGCAAAVYYPKPYLRAMGDVDFLVSHDKFNAAIELMESNGYSYLHGKDDDGNLMEGERHICYSKNGIEFELHHHFSSDGFDIDDVLESAIEKRKYRELNGYSIPMLPDIENGLVLLGHINHHLKSNNLGLRQIIDWEMYLNSVMDSGEWEHEFVPLAKEIGLLDLAVNVTKMCEKHLGLPNTIIRKSDMDYDISDELLEVLLTDGNFGRKKLPESTEYESKIHNAVSIIKSDGLFGYFQKSGLYNWKLCKKYPVLKPLAFIYGMFRFCGNVIVSLIKIGNVKKQIDEGKKKYDFRKKLGIRTEDQQL